MSISTNLIKRVVSGAIFAVVMVGGILYNPLSFGVLMAIVSALCVIEFGGLVNNNTDASVNRPITALGSVYLFVAFMSYCTDTTNTGIFIPYLLLLLYMIISELYLKHGNPLATWGYSMLSQIYIGLPLALLNVLAFHNDGLSGVSYNPILPLSVFAFLWVNDTGAYFIGTLLGKHRLFERISPKKSWEGSIGGGVVTLVLAYIISLYFPILGIGQWLGLALVMVVFGTWGDLTESLLKRQIGVKDSGNMIPGHGGILDRFDSSLMAIPAATAYLYFISLI